MQQINITTSAIWSYEFLGNSLASWVIALGVFFISLIILKVIKVVVIKRIHKFAIKTKSKLDDIGIEAINKVHWPFYVIVSAYLATSYVTLSDFTSRIIYFAFIVSSVFYAIKALERYIDYGAEMVIKKQKEEQGGGGSLAIVQISGSLIKFGLWGGAILLIISNLGINVTSLVAGLGIGGLAVALAIKEILSDLFSSFSIFFDKPFKVGDFIVSGSDKGTVTKIGIKTTRLQSLVGEELVISNTTLTKATLQNFGKLEKRRVSFNIFVDQETTPAKLKKIPGLIAKIIKKEKIAEVSRVHFSSIDESNFIFNIVYFANTSNYVEYMDAQQAINIGIVEMFSKEKIHFSHPTQTVYVKKGSAE